MRLGKKRRLPSKTNPKKGIIDLVVKFWQCVTQQCKKNEVCCSALYTKTLVRSQTPSAVCCSKRTLCTASYNYGRVIGFWQLWATLRFRHEPRNMYTQARSNTETNSAENWRQISSEASHPGPGCCSVWLRFRWVSLISLELAGFTLLQTSDKPSPQSGEAHVRIELDIVQIHSEIWSCLLAIWESLLPCQKIF